MLNPMNVRPACYAVGVMLLLTACLPVNPLLRGGTAAEASGGLSGSSVGQSSISPGQMTAGEWRDLDNWGFWEGLFDWTQTLNSEEFIDHLKSWQLQPPERIPVRVEAAGLPVVDISVRLFNGEGAILWEARTDNQGRAELFTDKASTSSDAMDAQFQAEFEPLGYTLQIGELERLVEVDTIPKRRKVINMDPKDAPADSNGVDLMLVVDTTSSMEDELSFFQAELDDVLARVTGEVGSELDLRVSVNVYRDSTDAYVVRPFPFTSASEARDQLARQQATGGGDEPEAVVQALDNAIHAHEWRPNARARLMLLVLDAPPHDDPQTLQRLGELIQDAARKGIRIIPVAGSGIFLNTEMLCRYINSVTGGTYVFVTDDSGIGLEHLKPTVGDFEVELLNDLLVRVLSDYMTRPKATADLDF